MVEIALAVITAIWLIVAMVTFGGLIVIQLLFKIFMNNDFSVWETFVYSISWPFQLIRIMFFKRK